jgi:hypothetical protein
MAVFNPELAARMKMPKELLDEASSLHFALHIGDRYVEAALYDAASSTCRWHVISEEFIGDPVEFIYQRNWHDQLFRKCTVSFDTLVYAIVPTPYFEEKQIAAYLQLQHGVLSNQPQHIELAELDAVCCFESPEWSARLMGFIPNARILPSAAVLARYAAIAATGDGASCVCWVTERQLTMVCLRQRKLHLLASNEVSSEEDVMYHFSNAAMRLGFDLEHLSLDLLIGRGMTELTELLSKYVRQVNTLEAADEIGSYMPQIHVLCA